jgi:hypothetical protein
MPDGNLPDSGPPDDDRDDGSNTYSPRAVLLAVAFLLLLVLAVLYIIGKLHDMSSIQDCVMQGRSNCA